ERDEHDAGFTEGRTAEQQARCQGEGEHAHGCGYSPPAQRHAHRARSVDRERLTHPHSLSYMPLKVSAIRMPAGPRITMNRHGRMNNTRGIMISTGTC